MTTQYDTWVIDHPDTKAVLDFAGKMAEKMGIERDKGKGGWDDPNECSIEELAELFIEHLFKGNEGNFIDLANFLMMLDHRSAHPHVLHTVFMKKLMGMT